MHRFISGKIIFYLLVCLALDVSFMPLFRFDYFYPPVFLYLAVLYSAFAWHGQRTLEIGIAAGFLKDLVSLQPLGIETAVLGAASFALVLLVQTLDRESLLNRFLTCFIFVLSVSFLVWGLSGFLVSSSSLSWYPMLACLTVALSTAVAMPLFFYFTNRWFKDHQPLKQYELFG